MVNRPTKQVWVDKFEPLQTLGFLVQPEVVGMASILIAYWSVLLGSFHFGGLIMLAWSPLAIYLTLGLFFCYLFIILDYTARGYQVPPRLSGSLLNSNKQRFFKGILLTSVFASLSYTFYGSEVLWAFVTVACVVSWSVSIAIIAIQDKFLHAINPLNWIGFYRVVAFDRVFIHYGFALIAALASTLLLTKNYGWLNIFSVTVVVFSFILLFRLLGILIHSNANALGISVRFGPEVEASQIAKARSDELSDFSLLLFQRVEANKTKQALKLYEDHLAKNNFDAEHELWNIITRWAKPDLAIRAGQGYIERLVKAQQLQEAWATLEFCYEKNQNQYQLLRGETVFTLANAATNSSQRRIAAELLRYFDKDFPAHPKSVEALLLAVEHLLLDEPDIDAARKLLNQIRIKFPATAKTRQYQKLKQLLDR